VTRARTAQLKGDELGSHDEGLLDSPVDQDEGSDRAEDLPGQSSQRSSGLSQSQAMAVDSAVAKMSC